MLGVTGLKKESQQEILNVLKSVDTDGSGNINYTGKHFMDFDRILGSNYGEIALHERGEIVLGIQNVRY